MASSARTFISMHAGSASAGSSLVPAVGSRISEYG
jgi:hypothetical protein